MSMAQKLDCQQVIVALQNSDLPPMTRDLLSKGLPLAAQAPPAERHAFQAELVVQVYEAVEKLQAAAVAKNGDISRRIEACEAELESSKAATEEASAAEERATGAKAEKAEAFRAASAACEAACQKHLGAAAGKEQAAARLAAQQQLRDRAAAVLECPLQMLRSRALEDDDSIDDALKGVCDFLQEAGADEVLLAGLPGAFRRGGPSGPFTEIIEQGAVDVVTARLAEAEAKLAVVQGEYDLSSTETLGLWAIHEVAQEAARAAEAELATAEAALADAKERCAEAAVEVAERESALAGVLAERTLHEATLEEMELAREAIGRLRSWDYPSAPAPAAPAPVPAPEAATVPMEVEVEADSCAAAAAAAGGAAAHESVAVAMVA